MDFSTTDEQEAARALTAEIFAERLTPSRLRAIEDSPDRVDLTLWRMLCATGVIGAVLPEFLGGAGLGAVGACLLLEEQGRSFAPIPLWPTLVATMMAAGRDEHAGDDEVWAVLRQPMTGDALVAVAFEEFACPDPRAPQTRARRDADVWLLDGEKAAVAFGHIADAVLVPARTSEGVGVFLVDRRSNAVHTQIVDTTTRELAATMHFTAATGRLLGRIGDATVDALADMVALCLSAVQLGVAASAVAQCATYVSARHQFGRPLGSWQSVQHALADCFLDVDAMRMTLANAAWMVDSAGEPADAAVAVAAWWAADAGERVVHRVQHLHGGIGVDLDYPIHRNLLWGRQIANQLGSGGGWLDRLGAHVASGALSAGDPDGTAA